MRLRQVWLALGLLLVAVVGNVAIGDFPFAPVRGVAGEVAEAAGPKRDRDDKRDRFDIDAKLSDGTADDGSAGPAGRMVRDGNLAPASNRNLHATAVLNSSRFVLNKF